MGASQLIGTAARIPERIGRRVSNSPVDAVASASPESARPFPGHDPASPVAGSEPARRLKSFPIPAPSLLQHQFQDRRLRWPTRPLILRARLMRRPLAASVCGGNPMKPTSGFSAIWAQPASALRMTPGRGDDTRRPAHSDEWRRRRKNWHAARWLCPIRHHVGGRIRRFASDELLTGKGRAGRAERNAGRLGSGRALPDACLHFPQSGYGRLSARAPGAHRPQCNGPGTDR